MTVDCLRPEGLEGPLVLAGVGRDLATGIDGEAYLIDAAATSVTVAPGAERTVTAVAADSAAVTPGPDGLAALVGQRAGSGFRKALASALPDLVDGGSLVHQLLDETPPAALIAGSVLLREAIAAAGLPAAGPGTEASGGEGGTAVDLKLSGRRLPLDICAGWAHGATMVRTVEETGIPLLGWGPPAPDIDGGPEGDPDPHAWHPLDPLPPRSMRRRRLIDLARGVGPDGRSATAPLRVEVLYRDTYAEPADPGEPDGPVTETVVHEYGVSIRVDVSTWTITSAAAVPGPLPTPECPSAADSASRLVGWSIEDLRRQVREELTGTTTCTHLNDLFRAVADAKVLWEAGAMARGERP